MSGGEDEQIPADMHLCGLDNLTSQVCYFNTGLQCLNACAPLKNFILSGDYHNRLPSAESRFLQAFEQQIVGMQSQQQTITHWLRDDFYQLHPAFVRTDIHHHCHAMMMATISSLHEGFSQPTEGPDRQLSKAPMTQACQEWKSLRSRNNSPLFDIFYGVTKSTLTCTKCHRISFSFSLFNSLQLPIPSDDRPTLADCLTLYFEGKMGNTSCPNCQSLECVKRTEIQQLPQVLVISFNREILATVKNHIFIDYPLNHLNMSKWCDQECLHRADPYQLTAVVTHKGEPRSGHNTAIVKHPTRPNWYEIDDQLITPLSISNVVTKHADVLVYQC